MLRSWLNGYEAGNNKNGNDYSRDNFLDVAFTQTGQAAIKTTSVINDDKPSYETEGGNDTKNQVYLLSNSEASNVSYGFPSGLDTKSEARSSVHTEYAKEKGIWTDSSIGYGRWWLRLPGVHSYMASEVTVTGQVNSYGTDVNNVAKYDGNMTCAIRSALHLNLSSNLHSYAGTVSSDSNVSVESAPYKDKQNNSKVYISKAFNIKTQSLQVSWKRLAGATKYHVQYSTAQGFDSSKGNTSNKNKIVIKGLKKKKIYYVRVRAQFKDGSWSEWSTVKKVKIKK